MAVENARRDEILQAAADLFGSAGIRASLQQVADAAGILPGSLYHHFESKDAIYVELVRRFETELDGIAARVGASDKGSNAERIIDLATAMAHCAGHHRAALLLTMYEPPPDSSPELVAATESAPVKALTAMRTLVGDARASGELRSEVDVAGLSERLCTSMFEVGVGVYFTTPAGRTFPEVKCRVLLDGIATNAPSERDLDGSAAHAAVEAAAQSWEGDEPSGTKRKVWDAARTVFGRHGFNATTVRDIAAEGGLSTGGVYRHIDSKEALFKAIMTSYTERLARAWDGIVSSASTPVEKIDALLWLGVHLNERFGPEHRMQSAGTRYRPPSSPMLGLTFPDHLERVKEILVAGASSKELDIDPSALDLWGRSVYALIWMPERVIDVTGIDGAMSLARETVLRGALAR